MSAEITIQGLSIGQQALADIIWEYNDFDDVQKFINDLPAQYRAEALTIVELMKLAVLEQLYDDAGNDTSEADSVIEQIIFKSKRS
jgi:hypothetical protein